MDLDQRNDRNNYSNQSVDKKSFIRKYWPGILVAVVLLWGIFTYNRLISLGEGTSNGWGGVQTAYQARADKVKNLISIVKGAADYEKETLFKVVEQRANAAKATVNIDAENLTPEKLAEIEKVQSKFTGDISRLLVTVENYPELKAVQSFQDFQNEYSGIENRIKKARDDFNEAVKNYNVKVKKFPSNLIAKLFSFEEKFYFEAQAGTENAPDIKF